MAHANTPKEDEMLLCEKVPSRWHEVKWDIPLATSSSDLFSAEDICKSKHLSPTSSYWINSVCHLQRTFRASQWYQICLGETLVHFSSSVMKLVSLSEYTFYGKRKGKCIIILLKKKKFNMKCCLHILYVSKQQIKTLSDLF